MTTRPAVVDHLIVHQFDPANLSPGGIDTCLRGIARYHPTEQTLAFVGVDAGRAADSQRLGTWERHEFGDRTIYFLPVTRLDPADQARRIPHSVRLAAGLARFHHRLPAARTMHAHRADIATVLRARFRKPLKYFIHTQGHGLTGATAESFWRYAGVLHQKIENRTVRSADSVVVFNPDRALALQSVNPNARFFPTWYDPALIRESDSRARPLNVAWVGRFELPKDPVLAVKTFGALCRLDPERPWTFDLVGSGTLDQAVAAEVRALPPGVASRINLRGKLAPVDVADVMARAGVFLMTSHPGREGFPMALVEAMASGLPAVVPHGNDTGKLITNGATGYVVDRRPEDLAAAIVRANRLNGTDARAAVKDLSAPNIVARIFAS